MPEKVSYVYDILKNLKNIQHSMRNHMHNHFKSLELTAPQGMLVFMVNKHEVLKISEISEKMGLSNSTVSGIVDRLEKIGCVERHRSDVDRRVVQVKVTELMKGKINCHENTIELLMTNVLSEATKEELQEVKTGLEVLSRLMENVDKGDENQC
jgi:DNA-binding MarR family transcriptional regulator